MAAENPHVVIFLGDYIYEHTLTGANVLRQHDGPTAFDLTGYPSVQHSCARIISPVQ